MQGTGGECGLRGGYVEMTNIHPGTIEEVYKCASINLSPNTMGQVAMSILMNPPKPGDASYETWVSERSSELSSLRRRAQMVTDGFNSMEGMSCNFTEGAMYSFPQVCRDVLSVWRRPRLLSHEPSSCHLLGRPTQLSYVFSLVTNKPVHNLITYMICLATAR